MFTVSENHLPNIYAAAVKFWYLPGKAEKTINLAPHIINEFSLTYDQLLQAEQVLSQLTPEQINDMWENQTYEADGFAEQSVGYDTVQSLFIGFAHC